MVHTTTEFDTAAVLTIRRAASMSLKGKKAVANWLRKQADALLTDGDSYTARVTIRYWFKKKKALVPRTHVIS